MGVLNRIRSGNRAAGGDTITNITTQEGQQARLQGQRPRVASLATSQPPPPPPPLSGRNNSSEHPVAATKLQSPQPNTDMQTEAAQLQQPTLPSGGRRRPQPKFPAVSTNKSDNTTTTMSETAVVAQVYGPNANLYTDVLSVSPTASPQELREAFFCLRYGIYQQLSEEGDANGPLSQEERKKVEMKMDAISAAFQILSDRNRRAMYDNGISQKQVSEGRGGPTLPSPKRDSPITRRETTPSPALSIGQKRSNYRRQMNSQQRRPIHGAMNERKVPAPVFVGETVEETEEEEPAVVPAFNGRVTRSGKQVSIKTSEEVIDQHQEEDVSPTGVDDFESINKFKNVKLDDNKSSDHRENESPEPDERTYDDEDDRTYDDDSRTYGTYDDGEDSYYTYGDATYGTYDDSTYVTYDDDETYGTYDEDRGKYSPSHKTVDKPEPILKGSTTSAKTDKKKSNRRVTIHSHRGRGENVDEGCPFPGLDDAFEELAGTYKDFKTTMNQVGSAFLLSPDDIDKLSDKIRDAQVEMVENYEKQQVGKKQQKVKRGVKLPKQPKKAIKN
mmetsp:Transcript_13146/g.20291  ORF Transcript_13146/g.20291 Transcript_13146/m.20291 type:complete len:558 (-) Transcript_13146:151-1824(-)